MSLDYAAARDEMLTLFSTAWQTTGHPVLFEDAPTDQRPADGSPWARVSIRHAGGEQATLAGETGMRRWRRTGTLFVQVFTPRGNGFALADSLGKVAAHAFQGKRTPGGVWFRDVSMREIGPDGPWMQVNVTAAFEYDEVT